MTEPIKDILPRGEEQPDVQNLLIKLSSGIEELVNFGTHILNWDVSEGEGSDENLPVVMMLRHLLELVDSISILIRQSSIDPCKLILRGVLETVFGIEYILQENTKYRALSFMVWHIHNQLKLSKKFRPGGQEYHQFEKKLKADSTGAFAPPNISGIVKNIQYLEHLLTLPLYAPIEAEYKRLEANGIKNPSWYQFFEGPKIIEQLAAYLNRNAFYEILYRGWSGPIHGTDIIESKLSEFEDGATKIVQIRYVKDAQTVAQHTFNLTLMIYKVIIEKRIPRHLPELSKWFITIRDFFLQLTNESLMKV
ncbi:MAG: DUF5677 domain-containing protein [Bacteroidota bacterium]|nr:DUF5677 domain-containing protein [Bacteroidota bacterium]